MSGNINSVFYAESYHPIQSGSIDGTDILPHDNAVYRAHLCSSAGLYDPFGDPKVSGDPYCTLFVGHLNDLTTEQTLHKIMSKYGTVKNLRLVRHIEISSSSRSVVRNNGTYFQVQSERVRLEYSKLYYSDKIVARISSLTVTGASCGYAFVEFESEREMRRAYQDAHHTIIDDSEIIVDYNRQQLMPGWIPRRLGGGIGGKKESGQLRFGGRERPFRAPLRPIPYDELKKLGIPAPPEGRYMTQFEVPPPPRRPRRSVDRDERTGSHKRHKHSSSSRQSSHRHEGRWSTSKDDHLSD